MLEKTTNENLVNSNNQPQQQLPFDVLLNEEFGKFQKNGFNRNWFVPIVKNQTEMDKLISIRENDISYFYMERDFPKILLEVNKDENGNLTSIYVLYSKGGKLYKIVSQKDYGVIKSRVELKNNKYVPYEKCDLVLFSGKVDERDGNRLVKSNNYKNGVKDGECFTYYKDGGWITQTKTSIPEYYEKTTYKNGKKNGEFENNKYEVKGNYIDNKKNGVWKVMEKDVFKEVVSCYKKKYDLKKYDCENFTKEHFKTFGYKNDRIWEVFYVNDVLNGKYEIGGYKGEFQLGLPNGVERYTRSRIDNPHIETINYVDGMKKGLSISYKVGDEYDNEENTIKISNYENGNEVNSIELSSNKFGKIPQNITVFTQHYLTEDVFYSLIKNDMNIERYRLEDFLNEWVVVDVKEFEMKNNEYGEEYKKCVNYSTIENKILKYDFSYFTNIDDYLINECGYPYFEEIESYYRDFKSIQTSDEYSYSRNYQPRVFTLSIKSNPTQVLINGELVDEKIGDDTNPIVLEFQKKVLQNLSDKMKFSYEKELKEKELEKEREVEKKQKERENNGLSINSFPID
mgnify:CR=1 FL=1